MTEQEKDDLQALAVQIFTAHAPRDPAPLMEAYANSLDLGRSFHACTITRRYHRLSLSFPFDPPLYFSLLFSSPFSFLEPFRTLSLTCVALVVIMHWSMRLTTTRRILPNTTTNMSVLLFIVLFVIPLFSTTLRIANKVSSSIGNLIKISIWRFAIALGEEEYEMIFKERQS